MGKTKKKTAKRTPPRRNLVKKPKTEIRVARELKDPVIVGYAGGNTREPASFWWNDEAYSVQRIIKRWRDEWRNHYFRVATNRGLFDIYEHRKVISLARKEYESLWFIAAELEVVEV